MSKQFSQFRIEPDSIIEYNPSQQGATTTYWSNNLIGNDKIVLGIAIYALPGTRFQINQINDKVPRTLVIGSLGVFQMDTETRPITAVYINREDCERTKQMYPITIDLIYNEGGGNE